MESPEDKENPRLWTPGERIPLPGATVTAADRTAKVALAIGCVVATVLAIVLVTMAVYTFTSLLQALEGNH
jgi:hypothetical protein